MSASLNSQMERVFKLGLESVKMRGIDALPLVVSAMMQLWADNPTAWGNNGPDENAHDDPSEEAHFQLGYAISTFIEKMGHGNGDQFAIEHLKLREEVLDAVTHIEFGTYAHGQEF